MQDESWADIPGYEGLYQASTLGRIKSLFRYKKVLKPKVSNAGYERVQLWKDRKGRWHSVHRLVALTFIENPLGKPEVNHKDEQKTNNVVANLEWSTREENNSYGTRLERQRNHTDYKKRRINNKNQIEACSIPIAQYSKDGKFIRTWKSASEFCRENRLPTASNIRECCLGRRKSAYGYVFKNCERGVDLFQE